MDETLRQLYEQQGLTIVEVAEEIGISVRTTRTLLLQHGITVRRRGPRRDLRASAIPESLREQLRIECRVAGVTQTAARNELSREVLHAILDDRPLQRGQKRKVNDSVVRSEYDCRTSNGESAGAVVADLAARFGCVTSTIHRSLRRTCVRHT